MRQVFHPKNMQGNGMILDRDFSLDELIFRTNNYPDLADRLIELQYELTDRLLCFIGGKRSDHKTYPHIALPEQQPK